MADFDAAQGEESLVDVGAAFEPDAQAAILVQPAMGAFDHPTGPSQPAAMPGAAACQDRLNVTQEQLPTVRLRIVRTIPLHPIRTTARPADPAADRRNGIDQGQQLRHVVSVGGGDLRRQRNAMGVREEVVFRAVFPAIHGAGPGLRPPKTARTEALSTTARDQSILSASCSLSSSTRWIFVHTLAFCQSRRRRQQVMPLPYPSSCGSSSQGIPVRSTNRMPHNVARWPSGLRPGYRRRRFLASGSKGSINSHNASSKIGLAIGGPPCPSLLSAKYQSFC